MWPRRHARRTPRPPCTRPPPRRRRQRSRPRPRRYARRPPLCSTCGRPLDAQDTQPLPLPFPTIARVHESVPDAGNTAHEHHARDVAAAANALSIVPAAVPSVLDTPRPHLVPCCPPHHLVPSRRAPHRARTPSTRARRPAHSPPPLMLAVPVPLPLATAAAIRCSGLDAAHGTRPASILKTRGLPARTASLRPPPRRR